MHGCGNDYVYIDCREGIPENVEGLAIRLSDRHKGIGGDGIILICKSDKADFLMRIFNADGSEGKMCGNGIRCVAKYVFDKGLTTKHHLEIDTLSGVKIIDIDKNAKPGDHETWVTVDMGKPLTEAVEETIELQDGSHLTGSIISMGNPHFVCYAEESPTDEMVHGKGPFAEKHERFPDRSNIEFAKVTGKDEVEMRVWERGSGETMACGTGACATAVAAILRGLTGNDVTVHLLGGDLRISLDDRGHVMMAGPAVAVFDGTIND